ncbi:MAG: hypothetical protein GF329_07025 [Candidatus Lokiarchaeota archaeon]|nr:hypothetical protein [Candidatus Lokiarchaeota archaeon]
MVRVFKWIIKLFLLFITISITLISIISGISVGLIFSNPSNIYIDYENATFDFNITQFDSAFQDPSFKSEFDGIILSGNNESLYYPDYDLLNITTGTGSLPNQTFSLVFKINVSKYRDFIDEISYYMVWLTNNSESILSLWLLNCENDMSYGNRFLKNWQNITQGGEDAIDYLLQIYNNSHENSLGFSAQNFSTIIMNINSNGTTNFAKINRSICENGTITLCMLGWGNNTLFSFDVFNLKGMKGNIGIQYNINNEGFYDINGINVYYNISAFNSTNQINLLDGNINLGSIARRKNVSSSLNITFFISQIINETLWQEWNITFNLEMHLSGLYALDLMSFTVGFEFNYSLWGP